MNKTASISGKAARVITSILMVLPVLLSSCSLFREPSKPTVKTCVVVPELTPEPQLPYREVNYKYPLDQVCNPKLLVFKDKRRLMVLENDILIRDYRIGLGPRPSGDKLVQGDGRTPEGEFYVCVKKPNSSYHKSLGLSYPSPKHAERALVAGNISPREFAKIVQAIDSRSRPPWDTVLGGQIFIHGGGAHEDWTKGCVALYNTDIDELFEIIPVGTPVYIMP
jgi:hypothetical protein